MNEKQKEKKKRKQTKGKMKIWERRRKKVMVEERTRENNEMRRENPCILYALCARSTPF